tara:strand:- start:9333 stop:9542 length:210 start_codon:yes stop_codon:yes gene_type:complete
MKEIYKELAIKYNLKPEQIKDIIISKFLFIRRELKSFDDSEFENLKTFHVTGFGKFFPSRKKYRNAKRL